MCSVDETRALINVDHLVTSEDDIDEEEMSTTEKFVSRFLHGMSLNEAGEELVSMGKVLCPLFMTSMLFFSRSFISTLVLSHLGELELAGGALATAFANVTGYSVLKGLSMGMEPICCQAYGAKKWSVVCQAFQRTLCLLLLATMLISVFWLNVGPIFLFLGQDPGIIKVAKVHLAFSIPELAAQSFLHPLRTLFRAQGLNKPLTIVTISVVVFHFPISYFLTIYLNLGVKGTALALASNTLIVVTGLMTYLALSRTAIKPWDGVASLSIFRGWKTLLSLALPSACSVCLEWWWYEIMLFLSGLLDNPQASVAAMGILIQTTGLLYVFPYSLSSALSTRVGHTLGADQTSRTQWATIIGLSVAAAYGLSTLALTVAARSVWGRLFTGEPHILDVVSVALPVLGFCEIGNSPQTAACAVLTGSARPVVGARINFYAFYLIGLPVAILMGFKFVGFVGLWFGLAAAQYSCLCMMIYTLIRTDWRHQAKRAEELIATAGDEDDLESSLITEISSP